MKLTYAIALLLIFSISLSIGIKPSTADALVGSSFKAGRIIDDGRFFQGGALTAGTIQAFLNAKVPVCDTWGTQSHAGTTRAAYAAARGISTPFTCLKEYQESTPSKNAELGLCNAYSGGTFNSAEIIYRVSVACGVSPQALIVTLQKEQSLITDDWPWPIQYRSAMGFGCPDTAPCDTEYYGFFNQVYNAARQFKRYVKDAHLFNYRAGRNNYIQYNPNSGCGGSTVYLETNATAALYNYTPYQPNSAALNNLYGLGDGCSAYGNRNFWRLYNDWFGSTEFPQPLGGILYSSQTDGKIYLTSNGSRYHIPSWDVMTNYRLDGYSPITVPDSTITAFSDGGTLTNLIWYGDSVYLVNNGHSHRVSLSMCSAWVLPCLDSSQVNLLEDLFVQDRVPTGVDLPDAGIINSTAYKIENGQRLPIANPETFNALGYNWNQIPTLNPSNSNYPLGRLLISTPVTINFPPDQRALYFDGTNYHHIPNDEIYRAWGFDRVPIFIPPQSSYNSTPPSLGDTLNIWVQDGSTKYLIDSGRRMQLTGSWTNFWSNAVFQTFSAATSRNLPTNELQRFIWSSPYIYMLDNGSKRHVPTYNDFIAWGLSNITLPNLSSYTMALTPSSQPALGNGTVVAIEGDARLFVVSSNTLVHITTPQMFDTYHFNWNGIRTFSSSLTNSYTISGSLANAVTEGGTYFYFTNGRRIQISPSQAVDYGINTSVFQQIAPQVLWSSNGIAQQITRFLYNRDTGRIYYASGGAIHYVMTYEAYVGYGGLRTPATVVDNAFISTTAIGHDI